MQGPTPRRCRWRDPEDHARGCRIYTQPNRYDLVVMLYFSTTYSFDFTSGTEQIGYFAAGVSSQSLSNLSLSLANPTTSIPQPVFQVVEAQEGHLYK